MATRRQCCKHQFQPLGIVIVPVHACIVKAITEAAMNKFNYANVTIGYTLTNSCRWSHTASMPYQAKTIAEYFLLLAKEQEDPITPMKMQKLIYFAHGWNLAIRNAPLIDEPVGAWPYGPVIRSIYDEYKLHGRNAIPFVENGRTELLADTETVTLLNKVWDVYRRYTAYQLSNMTHEHDTPWQKAIDAGCQTISNEAIRQYFVNRAQNNKTKL